MKRKELTKILKMTSNWKTNFGLHGLYIKCFSALRVKTHDVVRPPHVQALETVQR